MRIIYSTTALFANQFLPGSVHGSAIPEKELEVKKILEKMQRDTLEFRDKVEEAYDGRCSIDTLKQCGQNNYDDCASVYPDQICLQKDELVIPECGDGDFCNALWSRQVSSVSIPAALARGSNGNPTDPELVETVCYTRQIERFVKEKYEQDEIFWAKYGVTPSFSYFGAHNGVFRIHPSIHNKQCGIYDHRKRPWYIAASSGPKDVVLVIDTSGSMSDYGRLDLAIESVTTIIETLTVADRVAIVAFSDDAALLGGQDRLIRATRKNKAILIELVSKLSPMSATNFHAAFLKAFDSLDNTIAHESTTGCNIAILFLTDGKITAGPGKEDVISLVNERSNDLTTRWKRDVYIFTYSLGHSADHDVTKAIACQTGGLWSPVDDFDYGGDLLTSMSSYYKLFALGLGGGENSEFTAWVEPYLFFRAGKMGTTVSAPVYHHNVSPPLFLGVVAIDSYMDALEQVLGEDAASSTMLDRFVRVSTALCPKLKLSGCERDALRTLGGGPEAACGACNRSDYAGIVPEQCRGVSDLPDEVWANREKKGVPFVLFACCEVGGSEPSEMCAATIPPTEPAATIPPVVPAGQEDPRRLSAGAIAGIAVGGAAFLVLLGYIALKMWRGNCNLCCEKDVIIVYPPPDQRGKKEEPDEDGGKESEEEEEELPAKKRKGKAAAAAAAAKGGTKGGKGEREESDEDDGEEDAEEDDDADDFAAEEEEEEEEGRPKRGAALAGKAEKAPAARKKAPAKKTPPKGKTKAPAKKKAAAAAAKKKTIPAKRGKTAAAAKKGTAKTEAETAAKGKKRGRTSAKKDGDDGNDDGDDGGDEKGAGSGDDSDGGDVSNDGSDGGGSDEEEEPAVRRSPRKSAGAKEAKAAAEEKTPAKGGKAPAAAKKGTTAKAEAEAEAKAKAKGKKRGRSAGKGEEDDEEEDEERAAKSEAESDDGEEDTRGIDRFARLSFR